MYTTHISHVFLLYTPYIYIVQYYIVLYIVQYYIKNIHIRFIYNTALFLATMHIPYVYIIYIPYVYIVQYYTCVQTYVHVSSSILPACVAVCCSALCARLRHSSCTVQRTATHCSCARVVCVCVCVRETMRQCVYSVY